MELSVWRRCEAFCFVSSTGMTSLALPKPGSFACCPVLLSWRTNKEECGWKAWWPFPLCLLLVGLTSQNAIDWQEGKYTYCLWWARHVIKIAFLRKALQSDQLFECILCHDLIFGTCRISKVRSAHKLQPVMIISYISFNEITQTRWKPLGKAALSKPRRIWSIFPNSLNQTTQSKLPSQWHSLVFKINFSSSFELSDIQKADKSWTAECQLLGFYGTPPPPPRKPQRIYHIVSAFGFLSCTIKLSLFQ